MPSENRSEQAIIVLDMINDIAHPESKNFEQATSEIIPLLQGELKYFRERMRPVIFCQTQSGKTEKSFSEQVIQPLSPRAQEISIAKKTDNAFLGTDLYEILVKLKIERLSIVGAFTHTSVIKTVGSALDLGFSVVVPETCVCAKSQQDHLAALHLINRWLSAG